MKSAPFFGANQSENAAAGLILTYDDNKKNHEGSLSISRFRTATKILLAFFSFFPHPTALAFFLRSNAHTHTKKEGAKTHGKAERRQRAVRFTRFLDYRLMFDSGRSFSLKKDLIRPPY